MQEKDKWFFMDGQFNLLGEGYDYAGSFEDGYAPVKIKDKWFVIDKNFNICGNKLASIGVLGPQRMDYAGIASALKVVIDSLKDLKGE